MQKAYVFERHDRQVIQAHSEEQARLDLLQVTPDADEYELVDVHDVITGAGAIVLPPGTQFLSIGT